MSRLAEDQAAQAHERRSRGATLRPPRFWRDALRRRLLAGADLLATAIALLVTAVPAADSFWPLAFLPVALVVAKLNGLYDRDHRALRHLTVDEIPAIGAAAAVTAGLLALLLAVTPLPEWTASGAIWFFVVAAGAGIALRGVARWTWWRRTPPELIGVVGDSDGLAAIRRKLQLFRDMHYDIGAECELETLPEGPERSRSLESLVGGVDRVIVSAASVEPGLISELGSLCHDREVKLSVVSSLRGPIAPLRSVERLADMPILELNTWDLSRSSLLIKRTFDLTVAAAALIVLALPLAALAVAVRLDSPGPAFFSQIRAGLGGRPFRMYKLRTMHVDAESRLGEVVDLDSLPEPAFKVADDPRVTRVGRVLRRLSLDELPQLVNVVAGEMSLVGPRPEQVEVVEHYSAEDRARLAVKPGITGPMQISGRGELTFSERLAVELEYVENPSLARDLNIILHTIPAVYRGTGAF